MPLPNLSLADTAILRHVFQHAPDPLLVVGADGSLLHLNPAAQRLIATAASPPSNLAAVLHPEDCPALLSAIAMHREAEEQELASARYRDGDGFRWVHQFLSMIPSPESACYLLRLRLPAPPVEQIASLPLDQLQDGMLLIDRQTCLRFANGAACRLLGQSLDQLLELPLNRVIEPWREHAPDYLWEQLASQRRFSMNLTSRHDGSRLTLALTFQPLQFFDSSYALLRIEDISERLMREASLIESERRFRTLVENAPDGIGRFTPECQLLYANPTLRRLVPYQHAGRIELPAEQTFGLDRQQHTEFAALVSHAVETGESMEREFIHGQPGAERAPRHLLVRLVPELDAEARIRSVIAISRDITGIRATERDLEASHARLRDLASRRENAREEERKLIAREIHDELGQHLTALRMGISMLRLQFGTREPGLIAPVERLMQLCDGTIQVVRDLATQLRPAALNMGLVAALEWLVDQFQRNTGLSCALDLPCQKVELDDTRATAAFRVAQEALTNVARHALASRITITLQLREGSFLLEIHDNGQGFDPRQAAGRSLGLSGLHERGLTLGGQVIVFSHPGQGTTVQALFPQDLPSKESP
ncbi:PAS domain S-box protein [Pseudomonas sp. NPDC047963]|nr:PAS domain S-box protein [Phycisphaerae bacterium]MCH2340879.1 PAS domain S-box protein [Pseudomonas sp.]